MKRKQSGFTLIEIAIVLVIIGLLLGGVLKGQELINSAKVKNLAGDFKSIPLYVYGYQDKFKALPGDDAAVATTHLGAAVNGVVVVKATTPVLANVGNGVINGAWNSTTETDESVLFWQHVRLAGLAAGTTAAPGNAAAVQTFVPQNADGGHIGITSGVNTPVLNLSGTYIVCSTGILGKFAKQMDTTLDDGQPDAGSVRVIDNQTWDQAAAVASKTLAQVLDADTFTVCMAI